MSDIHRAAELTCEIMGNQHVAEPFRTALNAIVLTSDGEFHADCYGQPQPVVAAMGTADESGYDLPDDKPDAELTAEDWKSIKGDMDFHLANDEGEI
jgi:hypothetical protein